MSDAAEPRLVARDLPRGVNERVWEELARANPMGALWLLLSDSGTAARSTLRSLMRTLIEEGRRFESTPDGARWRALLEQAPAVRNGWLLWNHANLDFYLRNAEPLSESPVSLLHDVWQALGQADIAAWLSEMSRVAGEIDAGLQAA